MIMSKTDAFTFLVPGLLLAAAWQAPPPTDRCGVNLADALRGAYGWTDGRLQAEWPSGPAIAGSELVSDSKRADSSSVYRMPYTQLAPASSVYPPEILRF